MPGSVKPQDRAVEIARAVLAGEIGILEGTRLLVPLLNLDLKIASDEDFNFLRGVDSETDDLPVGRVRQEWHPDSLPAKDVEIARCENLWGSDVRCACERIIWRADRTKKEEASEELK